MRVLIVEDESLLAERLANILGERGYVVNIAADEERGDFLVSTEPYDAVILDLGLPRIDGLTLLERWRAGGIAVPVLVLTARAEAGARKYAASTAARTITSPSLFRSKSCWRGSAR
jgi:two-component system OmpR family response regulator